MKKIKRLPTILGILILLAGITAGVFLVQEGRGRFLQASPEITPKQIKIANITDQNFSVSWITDSATSGFIKYGTGKELTFIAQDDRDEASGQTGSFTTHHVTLKGLKPATNYFFKISSAKKVFANNGQEYQATTAASPQGPLPKNDVAYGTIVKSDGSPAEGVIVYLSLKNAIPQSTLSKASGSWYISLNSILANNLTSYVAYDLQASTEEIFVQGANLGTATAIAVTENDSPIPTITLGQTFDFRTTPLAEPQEPTLQPTIPQGRFPIGTTPSPGESQLTIINPDEDEEINTLKPEFLGTGPAGETLTIEIQSPETLSDQITIGENGAWNWTPPANLLPGEHTITVTLPDGRSISRLFTVLAAGNENSPSFTASPSATLTPSPAPDLTATPSPTLTATPSPTATPSGRTSIPSTEAGIPDSGNLTPTFLFSIIGTTLIGTGLLFNIFKKFS